MKKYLLVAAAIILAPLLAQAQDSKHEVTISVGGGLATLKNKTTSHVSDKKNPMGVNVGLGYTYLITENWGIQTGLEYAMYSSKMKIYGLEGTQETTDNEGDVLYYSYTINGMQEKQDVGYLQIPIMAHYQLPLSLVEDSRFYAAAGVKIGLPIKKSFEHTGFLTSAHYPDLNATILDLGEQGFGNFLSYKTKGDLSIKTAFFASMEAGVKWRLMDELDLHTGVYFDYSLNNVNKYKKEDFKSFVSYNEKDPSRPKAVSATEALATNGKGLAEKLTPIAVGIKIKLGFKL